MRAEAAGTTEPWRQQAVLGRTSWDAYALHDVIRDYALDALAKSDARLVIDETGFLKQGKASCGVGCQYTGSAAKIGDGRNSNARPRSPTSPDMPTTHSSADACPARGHRALSRLLDRRQLGYDESGRDIPLFLPKCRRGARTMDPEILSAIMKQNVEQERKRLLAEAEKMSAETEEECLHKAIFKGMIDKKLSVMANGIGCEDYAARLNSIVAQFFRICDNIKEPQNAWIKIFDMAYDFHSEGNRAQEHICYDAMAILEKAYKDELGVELKHETPEESLTRRLGIEFD